MNLNTLHLFVAIVQTGSLSKASERTGVPIATISRQIAELEKHLQIQLFDRQKSGVKPTMAGQKLYDEVHLSIDNLLNTKQVLFDDEQNLKGVLRISTVPACEPILGWVGEFQAQFPHIQTHCTMTDRALDMTADGIDVAFRMGELHGEQFIAKKCCPSAQNGWLALTYLPNMARQAPCRTWQISPWQAGQGMARRLCLSKLTNKPIICLIYLPAMKAQRWNLWR